MGGKRTAASVISDSDDDALFAEIFTSYEAGGNVNREFDKDHTSDDGSGNLSSGTFTESDHSSDKDYDCKGNTHHSQSNKEKGKVTDKEMKKHKETKWKQLHRENVSVGGGVVLHCHWCRQRSERPHVRCSRCTIKFCPSCLKNRNGENIEEEMRVRWVCPRCRGGCGRGCTNCCNCGPCRKTQRLPPTGPLARTAREAGFSSVHDYLISLKTKESAKVIARRKEGRGWTYATGAVIAYSDILRIPSWGKKGKRKWKKHRRSFARSPFEESEQDVIHGKKYRRDSNKPILAFPISSGQRDVTSIDTAGTSKRSIPSRVESEEQASCTIHDRAVESGSEETQRYKEMVISLDAMNLSSINGDQTGSPAKLVLELRKTRLLPKHYVVPKRKRSARKSTSRRREHDLSLDKSASTREELDHRLEQNTSRVEELDSKVDQMEFIREELDPKVDESKPSSLPDVHWSMKLLSYTEEELVSEVVQSVSTREELNLQVHQSKSRREEVDLKVDQRKSIGEELDLQVHQSTSRSDELDPKVDQSTSRREGLDPNINQRRPRRHELDPKVCQVTRTREERDPKVDGEKREQVQMSPSFEIAERRQLEIPDLNTTAPRNEEHSDPSSHEEDITDVTPCNETELQVPPSAESAGTSQTSDSFQKRLDLLLQRPFLTEQLKRMWSHFNLHFVDISDFTEKIARTYTPGGKLKLLRGFFFWLKHSSMEGAFQPWASENTEDNQTEDCASLSGSDSQVIDELLSIGANICKEVIGEKSATFHFPSFGTLSIKREKTWK